MGKRPRLDRGTAGQFMLLRKGAAKRILEVVGFPLRSGITVADLQRALELLTNELIHASFSERVLSSELEHAQSVFDRLLVEFRRLRKKDFPPPAPPRAWVEAVQQWVALERDAQRKRPIGRPNAAWDHVAYTRLIGIYEFAFKRKASASSQKGPTFRFILNYLSEVNLVLGQTSFSDRDDARRVLAKWSVPQPDALRKKIEVAQRWAKEELEKKEGAFFAWQTIYFGLPPEPEDGPYRG